MKRTVGILMFSLFVIIFVFPQGKPIITVLDFTANGIAESDANAIVSFLSSSIFETRKFEVIDKAQRDVILTELEFSLSGCADESCQLEIGKLLAAEYIIVGDVSKVGSRYILNTKMIETESSKTINTAKGLYGSMDDLLDNIVNLAVELSDSGEPEKAAATEEAVEVPVEISAAEQEKIAADRPELAEELLQQDAEQDSVKAAEDDGKIDIKPGLESAPERTPMRTVAAWTGLGIGAAAAAVGTYLIYDALAYKTAMVDPAYEVYMSDEPNFGDLSASEYFDQQYSAYTGFFDIFKGKSILALSVTGGGIISLAASVLLFVLPSAENSSESGNVGFKPAFSLEPALDGITLLWSAGGRGMQR